MDPLSVINLFNAAWNDHDLDAALAFCTDDVVFEGTDPAPDGRRYAGREAVAQAWRSVFEQEASHFDFEEIVVCDPDRLVQRWRYDWGTGHVRGIDLIKFRHGLIAEKLSYVKG